MPEPRLPEQLIDNLRARHRIEETTLRSRYLLEPPESRRCAPISTPVDRQICLPPVIPGRRAERRPTLQTCTFETKPWPDPIRRSPHPSGGGPDEPRMRRLKQGVTIARCPAQLISTTRALPTIHSRRPPFGRAAERACAKGGACGRAVFPGPSGPSRHEDAPTEGTPAHEATRRKRSGAPGRGELERIRIGC